jgi:hypothetical protein
MDVLEYMERESGDTLKELMRDYAASFDRVTKIATALAAGSVAMMVWSWDKLGVAAKSGDGAPHHALGVVLALVALCWIAAAGWALWRGALSNNLDSGANVVAMSGTFKKHGGSFDYAADAERNAPAVHALRAFELGRRRVAATEYAAALNRRAKAINVALQVAVGSAAAGMLAGLLLLLPV